MLESIKSFLEQNIDPDAQSAGPVESSAESKHEPLHVAVCALLLELAHADDDFTEDERRHIEEALVRHFALPADTVHDLIALADEERKKSIDFYQFTKLIANRYDVGQKMVLAEIMWRVVYADGELAKHESYLMRKISPLLGLKPGYLAEAKKKVTDG